MRESHTLVNPLKLQLQASFTHSRDYLSRPLMLVCFFFSTLFVGLFRYTLHEDFRQPGIIALFAFLSFFSLFRTSVFVFLLQPHMNLNPQ